MEYDYSIKFIILGDINVGKSSFLKYYIYNKTENLSTTIGVDYYTKYFNLNNKIIKVIIWDTAGQERFKAITKLYLKNVTNIFLMFDLSNLDTFLNLKDWMNFIKKNKKDNIKITLIGNKNDKEIKVLKEDIDFFCLRNDIEYYETNSINSKNINHIFKESLKYILKNKEYYNLKKYNTKNLFNDEKRYRYKYCCF